MFNFPVPYLYVWKFVFCRLIVCLVCDVAFFRLHPLYLRTGQTVITGGTNASISEVSPSKTMSNMPWQNAVCKYSWNEIYFDMVVDIDALINALGRKISSDVSGSIQAQAHLSSVPEILLKFFWSGRGQWLFKLNKVVSFVPPSGAFALVMYRLKVN